MISSVLAMCGVIGAAAIAGGASIYGAAVTRQNRHEADADQSPWTQELATIREERLNWLNELATIRREQSGRIEVLEFKIERQAVEISSLNQHVSKAEMENRIAVEKTQSLLNEILRRLEEIFKLTELPEIMSQTRLLQQVVQDFIKHDREVRAAAA